MWGYQIYIYIFFLLGFHFLYLLVVVCGGEIDISFEENALLIPKDIAMFQRILSLKMNKIKTSLDTIEFSVLFFLFFNGISVLFY